MAPVAWRVWIVTRWNSVRVTPATVPALNSDFSAAKIPYNLLRPLLGITLSVMHAAGSFGARFLDRPALRMPCYVAVIFHIKTFLSVFFQIDSELVMASLNFFLRLLEEAFRGGQA